MKLNVEAFADPWHHQRICRKYLILYSLMMLWISESFEWNNTTCSNLRPHLYCTLKLLSTFYKVNFYLLTATSEMTGVFQRLCHMKPGSGVGMVGLGSVLLHQKEFLMARALLQKGIIQKKKRKEVTNEEMLSSRISWAPNGSRTHDPPDTGCWTF